MTLTRIQKNFRNIRRYFPWRVQVSTNVYRRKCINVYAMNE
ncbi:MAG TPA: hypothetical protein VKM55_26550 [Candidatus Lokiarchaeia archaeon]|nr:hypothetical protein [Candidatus Lokiarchaeia archaeon]